MVEVHAATKLTVDSTLDEHATVLRAYVDQQEAHLIRLEAEVEQVRSRIARGKKAVAVLAPGEAPTAKPEKAGKTAKGGKRANPERQAVVWTPSPALVEKVRAGLEEHSGSPNGITINRLAEATGVAGESVKRSLEVLRERGEARFLGIRDFPTKAPGKTVKARAYKSMPRGAHDESPALDDELSRASSELVESLSGGTDGGND